MKTDEPVVLSPFVARCLEVVVAMTLAVMVAIVVMDEKNPTLETTWGHLDASMSKPVLHSTEASSP